MHILLISPFQFVFMWVGCPDGHYYYEIVDGRKKFFHLQMRGNFLKDLLQQHVNSISDLHLEYEAARPVSSRLRDVAHYYLYWACFSALGPRD